MDLNFPRIVPGCVGSNLEAPWRLVMNDGTTRDATAQEVLNAAKDAKKTGIRLEAQRRLLAKYPDWRQRSAALGVYPASYVTTLQNDIASVIAASNAAEDAADAASTVAEVEAVTATWPVI